MELIRTWFTRRFSDPQVLILSLLLLFFFAVVLLFGGYLMPLFTAVIIAYLLEGITARLERVGIPRIGGVLLVTAGFVMLLVFLMVGVIPPLSRQITQFVSQLPNYVIRAQDLLQALPERYPNLITQQQVADLTNSLQAELAVFGQKLLASTLASVTGLFAVVVFVVLVPLLVFFLMKDKYKILNWIKSYLPQERELSTRVWGEVDQQIGNYVRGKTLEILIVGAVTFVAFSFLDVQYTVLLAVLVGFSVLIPYIGAAVATLPVALVAFFQFGWSSEFGWVMATYGIIQLLDGNALVPLLFSEVVDLHPIAIIVAVLLFGGIWGFWGVFFAIPLATLVNAVMRALPGNEDRAVVVPERISE